MAKEFQLDISQMFQAGLRPRGRGEHMISTDAKDKLKYLEVAKEVIIDEEGTTAFNNIQFPLSTAYMTGANLGYTYPQGQALKVDYVDASGPLHYWFNKTDIKTFRMELNGTPSVGSITVYDIRGSGQSNISGTLEPWTFAYFNIEFFLAFNGKEVIVKHNLAQVNNNYSNTKDKFLRYDDSIIYTGCNHRGRLLLANFQKAAGGEGSINASMKRQFDQWASDNSTLSTMDEDYKHDVDWGSRTVGWSSIGGGDALIHFYPELMQKETASQVHYDDYGTSENAYHFRRTMENQSGWMVLPYNEPIISVLPFGKNIIVQTMNNTGMLTLESKPIATYGFRHVAGIGLHSKNAITKKNNEEVMFLGNNGGLYTIDAKGNLNFKDYRMQIFKEIDNEVFEGAEADFPHCFLHWDESLNVYLLSTPNNSFIISDKGVSETQWRFTGRVSHHPLNRISPQGMSTGIAANPDYMQYCYISGDTMASPYLALDLQTESFQFAPKGLCQLNWVQLNLGGVQGIDYTDGAAPALQKAFYYVTVFYKTSATQDGAHTANATTSYNSGTPWRFKTIKVANENDSFYFGVQGYQFKVRIHSMSKQTYSTSLPVDNVILRWSLVDKRFTRGAY